MLAAARWNDAEGQMTGVVIVTQHRVWEMIAAADIQPIERRPCPARDARVREEPAIAASLSDIQLSRG
jgi:hypothetical protein